MIKKTKNKHYFFNIMCLLMIMLLSLSACSKEEDGKKVSSGDEDAVEAVTTDFEEDTVFTVGDMRVSLSEWYLYALPKISEMESLYGKDIWSYKLDNSGKTMSEAMKENIRDRIAYVKIVAGRAGEYGLALTEDDLIDINIQTQDYLNALEGKNTDKYKITEAVIKQIYSDNILALKVYENLTLNIDTYIPEEQVRHMVLQYVSMPKYEEADDGTVTYYDEEELKVIRTDLENYLDEIRSNPEITKLTQGYDDKVSILEITANYEELTEKLPEELAEIAFSLEEGKISDIYETDDFFFILDCVDRTDEEETDKARIAIIEQRQEELFNRKYSKWQEAAIIKTNYRIWDEIVIE